jgi:integrase
VEHFSTPDKLSRVATARRFKRCPTLTQIRAMLDAMPKKTEIDKRDHALVAFTILSGARDGAIISFRLKHIDIERGMIEQNAREVRTKHAKTFTTWFFPVGDDIRQIVIAWIEFLREQKGFGPDDPLFPKTKIANGDNLLFHAVSIGREPWSNANPVRGIFRGACGRAGLPYFNPHSLRNTLVQIAYDQRLDAEAFKAWSQNLGHESCLTTFSSYGTLPPGRQAEIMRQLAAPRSATEPGASSVSAPTSKGDPVWGSKRSARLCRGSLKVRVSTWSPNSSRSRPAKEVMRSTGDSSWRQRSPERGHCDARSRYRSLIGCRVMSISFPAL